MPEVQLVKVVMDHTVFAKANLRLLEIMQQCSRRIGEPLGVIVVDSHDRIHCGTLEKVLYEGESYSLQRDLVVGSHEKHVGYLFDDEIKELYILRYYR